MTVQRLRLQNFTAFEDAEFVFDPQINVMIGENSTGKTHALKALYAILKATQQIHLDDESGLYAIQNGKTIEKKLATVFNAKVFELIRRANGYPHNAINFEPPFSTSAIEIVYNDNALRYDLNHLLLSAKEIPNPSSVIFMPPREFLSLNPGFLSAFAKRELAFDETYYDLALALDTALLRNGMLTAIADALAPLEDILGGANRVEKQGNRFFVKTEVGLLPVDMVSDGIRKIAMLYYLLKNGEIQQGSIVLWDEPEQSLNPRYIVAIVEVLKSLARMGVQMFIATHDWLLTQELSLLSEYPSETSVRFFGLYREDGSVQVASAESLVYLEHNPIQDEYAAHHDRDVLKFLEAATV